MNIEVCFSPQSYPLFDNKNTIVVVIDILRASSAITTAFFNGVSKMIPIASLEEAYQYKKDGFIVLSEKRMKNTDTKKYAEKITVDELADKFGIGRRTFERRFKKATTNTVIEYIQRVKIEAAKKQLESGRKTVNEVMYDVGYTDVKAFRDVFKKVAGMSPVDYRNKYNK